MNDTYYSRIDAQTYRRASTALARISFHFAKVNVNRGQLTNRFHRINYYFQRCSQYPYLLKSSCLVNR